MNLIYFFPTELPIAQSHGVQTLNTCLALARLGTRVELIVRKLHGSPEYVLGHYGIECHPNLMLRPFGAKGSKFNKWSGRGFRVALRAFALRRGLRPGTVFYVRGTATALRTAITLGPVCRLVGKPLIYEVHGIQHLDLRQTHGGRYGTGADLERTIEIRRELETRAFRRVTAMVCISSRLKELVAERFGVTPPTLIAPSGVPESAQQPPTLGSRGYDVAYVGGLYGFNGVDLLLQAVAKLPDVRAAIVGGGLGNEQHELQALAHELKIHERVTFTGHLPHAQALDWMRRAKVLAAPLKPSGQVDRISWCSPGKIVEYMAAGGAIVASRLENLKDLLRDEENALLVPPNDVLSLAGATERLLSDTPLARRLAERALADSRHYTYEARAQKIMEFLMTQVKP